MSCRLMAMTKRLQVLFDDEEYRGIQRIARASHMTVAEWVRQSLRQARLARQSIVEAKLRAVDEASRHSFPVGDIDAMLREIEANRLPE